MRLIGSILLLSLLTSATAQAGGDAAAGKAKADQVCAACHGADGNSPSPEFPILAGQYRDYLVQALGQYQSGQRTNPIMQGIAKPLTAQEIQDLAAYFASQQGPLKVARR
jgi:cytochrome c553